MEQLPGHTLPWLPVFQIAPLSAAFREAIAKERDLLIKTIRLERDREPEAVIIRTSQEFLDAWPGLPIPDCPENSFTREHHLTDFYEDWIGMTRSRTWVDPGSLGPPALDDVGILSLYVNQLVGLDENGARPRRPRQGPIPDEDEKALSDLAP